MFFTPLLVVLSIFFGFIGGTLLAAPMACAITAIALALIFWAHNAQPIAFNFREVVAAIAPGVAVMWLVFAYFASNGNLLHMIIR